MIPHLHPYVQTRKGEIECVALDNSPFHAGRDPRGYADVVGEHAASVERDREAYNQNQDARRSHTGVPPRPRKLQTGALMGFGLHDRMLPDSAALTGALRCFRNSTIAR